MNWPLRLYQLALRLYPRRFRQEYDTEMQEVFHQAQSRAGKSNAGFLLRELADLPGSVLREHLYETRAGNAGINTSLAGSTSSGSLPLGPPSGAPHASGWLALLTGLLPFLWGPLFGLTGWLISTIWKSPPDGFPTGQSPTILVITGNLLALLLLVIMILLVIAWRRGFPAWSYPLGMQFLMLCLYGTNLAMPGLVVFGYRFDRDILGWFPLALPLIVMIAGLLASLPRPLDPLRAGLKALRADPTRLTFGLFGFSPLLLRIIFDEVHGEGPFLIGMDIFLSLAALLYLRGRKSGLQAATIFAGLLLAWLASSIYLGVYWEGRLEDWMTSPGEGMTNFRSTLTFGLLIIAITFFPWTIHQFKKWRSARKAGKG